MSSVCLIYTEWGLSSELVLDKDSEDEGCDRRASKWGKKEDRGHSELEYLASTWSCSGCRLASMQTLWHKVATLWLVFCFSWSRWLFSITSFSLSDFCDQSAHNDLGNASKWTDMDNNTQTNVSLPVCWFHTAGCKCTPVSSCGSAEQPVGSCCVASCRGQSRAAPGSSPSASEAAGSRSCSGPWSTPQRMASESSDKQKRMDLIDNCPFF